MFQGSIRDDDAEIAPVTEKHAKKRRGPRLKRTRDVHRVDRYYDRKARQVCTTCEASLPDDWDKGQCRPCLDKAKDSNSKYMTRLRRERRERGECSTGCGRQSTTYRCLICSVRAGEVPAFSPAEQPNEVFVGVDEGGIGKQPRFRTETIANKNVKSSDADLLRTKTTQRYIGQGKRGSPAKTILDQQDIAEAVNEIERARQGFAHAQSAEVAAMGKFERESAELEWLSRVALAKRFLDEILDRHDYES